MDYNPKELSLLCVISYRRSRNPGPFGKAECRGPFKWINLECDVHRLVAINDRTIKYTRWPV